MGRSGFVLPDNEQQALLRWVDRAVAGDPYVLFEPLKRHSVVSRVRVETYKRKRQGAVGRISSAVSIGLAVGVACFVHVLSGQEVYSVWFYPLVIALVSYFCFGLWELVSAKAEVERFDAECAFVDELFRQSHEARRRGDVEFADGLAENIRPEVERIFGISTTAGSVALEEKE